MRPAILRAKVLTELSAYATRAATERISTTTALGTMSASIPRDVATSRPNVPNHDAKHAAGRTTETHGATNALSTNARTKARRLQKGHNKKNCPETMDPICAICEAEARSFECPEHTCTQCNGALPVSLKGQNLQPVRRNWALSTKPTARRCRNRLAEPTVPGIEPSPAWQCCSHPPGLSRP